MAIKQKNKRMETQVKENLEVERFLRTPKIGDIVKVYGSTIKAIYGKVVCVEHFESHTKGIHKREVLILKDCEYHDIGEIDYFLSENRVDFIN